MIFKSTLSQLVVLFLVFVGSLKAQNPGDTITVQSLNFNSGVRDTVIDFRIAGAHSYEKVYMQYTLRCKNAQVSTGSNRNLGCGEWDYSCNTYLHDSSHVDSIVSTHPDYIISGYSGSSFDYSNTPMFDLHQTFQQAVTVNSTITDTASIVGTGTLSLDRVLATDTHAGKSQYLFTAAELISAGVHAGNIDALTFNLSANPGAAKLFKIRLKSTSALALTDTLPNWSGFTEVYFHETNFAVGTNKIQFSTPFLWDGVSSVIIETLFTNKVNASAMIFAATSGGTGIHSYGDSEFHFNGDNYAEAPYKGVLGSTNRTIEAWIKTTATGKEIVSWGANSTGQKYLMRLDGSGRLRLEVNGGNRIGTTVLSDGNWHHVAAVLNGSNTNQVTLYVDGVQEAITATAALAINTTAGIDLRITKGHHNLMWDGEIADIRIWDTNLNQAEIENWRFKKLDNTHPNYSNLQLYYPLNEGAGNTIYDNSTHGRNATVINGAGWNQIYGEDHFKNVELITMRPNLTFHQGQYNLSISTDTILDTVVRPIHLVNQYAVFSKAGTVMSDSIGVINSYQYWEAAAINTYNPSGTLVGTTPVVPVGTINIVDLSYYQRNPSKFEIMSFVTPYGIGIDFGQEGHTWTFDMSDFMPILNGKKRMTIERGGQWQEEMDIKFLFVVGTPPRDVLDIQQVWKVDKTSYANISNDIRFEPRDVMMHPNGKSFKINSAITGHGQQGEFIPQNHWVNINGGASEFNWQVWKECAENPIYPQGGTWIYDRAGWCPGMATDIAELDITSYVTAGQAAKIDYGITTASGTSDYIVSHQLVTYGDANFALDAAVIDIITPTSKIEYGRIGSICKNAVIKIQNTGSDPLTSLTINYWVNNAPTPKVYNWTGTLAFMETAEVELPVGADLWHTVTGAGDNFYVEVSAPNGGADGYVHNNKAMSTFTIPEVLSSDFYVWFRTNNVGSQNSYTVEDEWGNVIISKSGLSSNTTYKDTLSLAMGCYTFRMEDTGDNGISFWANSEGSGSLMFRRTSDNFPLKVFDGDFGDNINFQFTVNTPLTLEEDVAKSKVRVYPNPATEKFTMAYDDSGEHEIVVYNGLGQVLSLPSHSSDKETTFSTAGLAKGVYYVKINFNDTWLVEKITVL